MTGANFTNADLSAADLSKASIVGADFSYAIVEFATYEPKDQTEPSKINTAHGLADLKYNDNPQPINKLRDSFRKGGFTHQENEVTRAIRRHEPRAHVELSPGTSASSDHPILHEARLENQLPLLRFRLRQLTYGTQQVLFDWPCGWGANPGRPLVIIAVLALLCTPVYWIGMHLTLDKGGLFLVATGERIPTAGAKERVRRISVSPYGQPATNAASAHHLGKKAPISARRHARRLRLKREYKAFQTALLFSLMSVFNIGFDGFNGGLWIRMLQSREFDIRARGWMRTVSGVQSLLGVGLLALAVLSYFGHPFE